MGDSLMPNNDINKVLSKRVVFHPTFGDVIVTRKSVGPKFDPSAQTIYTTTKFRLTLGLWDSLKVKEPIRKLYEQQETYTAFKRIYNKPLSVFTSEILKLEESTK